MATGVRGLMCNICFCGLYSINNILRIREAFFFGFTLVTRLKLCLFQLDFWQPYSNSSLLNVERGLVAFHVEKQTVGQHFHP